MNAIYKIHVMLRMIMNLMWISAMNGHTECLRLLMETAEDSNIVDCTDAYERYVLVIVFLMPPLKKGAYCFATVGRSVCRSVGR